MYPPPRGRRHWETWPGARAGGSPGLTAQNTSRLQFHRTTQERALGRGRSPFPAERGVVAKSRGDESVRAEGRLQPPALPASSETPSRPEA